METDRGPSPYRAVRRMALKGLCGAVALVAVAIIAATHAAASTTQPLPDLSSASQAPLLADVAVPVEQIAAAAAAVVPAVKDAALQQHAALPLSSVASATGALTAATAALTPPALTPSAGVNAATGAVGVPRISAALAPSPSLQSALRSLVNAPSTEPAAPGAWSGDRTTAHQAASAGDGRPTADAQAAANPAARVRHGAATRRGAPIASGVPAVSDAAPSGATPFPDPAPPASPGGPSNGSGDSRGGDAAASARSIPRAHNFSPFAGRLPAGSREPRGASREGRDSASAGGDSDGTGSPSPEASLASSTSAAAACRVCTPRISEQPAEALAARSAVGIRSGRDRHRAMHDRNRASNCARSAVTQSNQPLTPRRGMSWGEGLPGPGNRAGSPTGRSRPDPLMALRVWHSVR